MGITRRRTTAAGSMQREGSVNSDAASKYPASGEGGSAFAALALAEHLADEAVPRVSRLTALIVLVLLSLGTWALIWAALASLGRG
jgi:hypothetical protein